VSTTMIGIIFIKLQDSLLERHQHYMSLNKPDPFTGDLPVIACGIRGEDCNNIKVGWERSLSNDPCDFYVHDLYCRSNLPTPPSFTSLFVLTHYPKQNWIQAYSLDTGRGAIVILKNDVVLPDIRVAAPDDIYAHARTSGSTLTVYSDDMDQTDKKDSLMQLSRMSAPKYCEARLHRNITFDDVLVAYSLSEFYPFTDK